MKIKIHDSMMTFLCLAAAIAAAALFLPGCSCSESTIEGDADAEATVDQPAEDAQVTDEGDGDGEEPAAETPEAPPDGTEADGETMEDPPPDVLPDEGDAVEEDVTPPPYAGCIEGDFQPYWGDFHAHTSNSDGSGTPAEAFAYARDVGGLDMMAVTDHVEQLYLGGDRWNGCRTAADDAYAPGTYLTICGFEYGSGRYLLLYSTGHNNVFFIDYLTPALQVDFRDFYQSVNDCPDCIAQYNHPGDSEYETWNNWEYFPVTDLKMNFFEFNTGGDAWALYFEALAAGWHISPMYDQDNHSANWGTANDNRSGFFMADLTRESLHQAMRERRSFNSTDKNAWVKLLVDGRCWMGSILTGVSTDVTIGVEAGDADPGDTFASIELYGPGPTLMDTHTCDGTETCAASFSIPAGGSPYAVARVSESDGNWLISAPVWLNP